MFSLINKFKENLEDKLEIFILPNFLIKKEVKEVIRKNLIIFRDILSRNLKEDEVSYNVLYRDDIYRDPITSIPLQQHLNWELILLGQKKENKILSLLRLNIIINEYDLIGKGITFVHTGFIKLINNSIKYRPIRYYYPDDNNKPVKGSIFLHTILIDVNEIDKWFKSCFLEII